MTYIQGRPYWAGLSSWTASDMSREALAAEGPLVSALNRPGLADKALSETFGRLRYRDTSLLIWQQQQQLMLMSPPSTYLNRSQSAWYSSFGNQAVLVQDKRCLRGMGGQSRICRIM